MEIMQVSVFAEFNTLDYEFKYMQRIRGTSFLIKAPNLLLQAMSFVSVLM